MIINDIFCSFVAIDDYLECSKCGTKITLADNISDAPLFPCRNPLTSINNKSQKIMEFMGQHNTPDLCSEQTIDYRLSICQQCEHYSNSTCSQCGCSLVRDRNYMNKLAQKSEQCPIGKWLIDN